MQKISTPPPKKKKKNLANIYQKKKPPPPPQKKKKKTVSIVYTKDVDRINPPPSSNIRVKNTPLKVRFQTTRPYILKWF